MKLYKNKHYSVVLYRETEQSADVSYALFNEMTGIVEDTLNTFPYAIELADKNSKLIDKYSALADGEFHEATKEFLGDTAKYYKDTAIENVVEDVKS